MLSSISAYSYQIIQTKCESSVTILPRENERVPECGPLVIPNIRNVIESGKEEWNWASSSVGNHHKNSMGSISNQSFSKYSSVDWRFHLLPSKPSYSHFLMISSYCINYGCKTNFEHRFWKRKRFWWLAGISGLLLNLTINEKVVEYFAQKRSPSLSVHISSMRHIDLDYWRLIHRKRNVTSVLGESALTVNALFLSLFPMKSFPCIAEDREFPTLQNCRYRFAKSFPGRRNSWKFVLIRSRKCDSFFPSTYTDYCESSLVKDVVQSKLLSFL